MIEGGAGGVENGAEVLEDAAGLRRDVAVDQVARRGIDRHLARDEQEVAGADRL